MRDYRGQGGSGLGSKPMMREDKKRKMEGCKSGGGQTVKTEEGAEWIEKCWEVKRRTRKRIGR